MHNNRVQKLLEKLEKNIIPDYVASLLKECTEEISPFTLRIFIQQMKARGINCRYLGLIFWWCCVKEQETFKGIQENEKDKGKEKETEEIEKKRKMLRLDGVAIELVARAVKIVLNRQLSWLQMQPLTHYSFYSK